MSQPQVPDDGVKHLTTGNWLEPDPICLKFVEVNLATAERRPPTGEGWAVRFLAVDLAPTVASEVRDMWEAARGMLLYGWFYYAIYAIGEHQLRRVADAAVLHRYQQAGGPPNKKPGPEGEQRWPDLMTRVNWLISAGVILPRSGTAGTSCAGCATRPRTPASGISRRRTKRCACSNSWRPRSTPCSLPSPVWTQTRPSREIAGEIVAPVRKP